MDYQLIWPSSSLRPYIQFYGLLRTGGPNGQIIEDLVPPYPGKGLIFSLDERPAARIYNRDFDVWATEGYFMPQCTHSWRFQISGQLIQLGVFFRPGMLRHFFHLPAADITNQVLPFSEAGFSSLVTLRQQLLESGSLWEKIERIEAFLKNRLVNSRFKTTLTDHFLFLMNRQLPGVPIDTLSNKLGVSNRYVRKVFQQEIGIPPKIFLQIHRFNIAFNLLKMNQFYRLSDIAYQLNYFDQSHFIKEFKHFIGVPPLQYLKEDRPLHAQLYWREQRRLEGGAVVICARH